MSKHETPMIHWYWDQLGGTLIEEFKIASRTETTGQRLIDGVIILGGPKQTSHWRNVNLAGKDIVVIQAKRGRLGMYLMGQTFFSAKLVEKYNPRTVKSIALCEKYDDVLGPLLEEYDGMEVVIYSEESSS